MERFRIFVSYRREDTVIARQLADTLRMYGNLELSLSESRDGLTWIETKETLRRTELLLLLLTPPSDFSRDMDWSLIEVGFFSGLSDPQKKIVALSPPNLEVPSVLSAFQHVQADRVHMTSFIEELFGRAEDFTWEDRHGRASLAAEKICALIAPLQDTVARTHTNSLILRFKETLQEPTIPEHVEAQVDAMSLKMFGLLEERYGFTWGDIQRSLHGETTWVSELSQAIYAISNGRSAKPIKSTFPSAEGQSFIPVVYRDETRSFGLRLFHVLFVPTDVVPVDPALVFVITAYESDMDPIYEAIQAAATTFSLSAKRVKDIVGDYRITNKILELIAQAKYVVADLTHERPNVYFELGYARGLGKTVITTVRKGTTVHFDVKDWTYIEYDDSQTLEHQLLQRLRSAGEREPQPSST